MACGVSRNFVRLLFGLILLTFGTFANAACVINAENGTSDTDTDSALSIVLKEGAQRLSLLRCQRDSRSLFPKKLPFL